MSCATLQIPYKAIFSIPIILKTNGQPIEFDGTLLFMIKENKTDPDADAIISKTLTIVNTDGDPYHALINLTETDTTQDLGTYFFGFKTGDNGTWLPTKTDTIEFVDAIVQGQTA